MLSLSSFRSCSGWKRTSGSRLRCLAFRAPSASVLLLLVFASPVHCQKPVVSKVEPPNWWVGLPDPMLLVRGEHLERARFSVSHSSATIEPIQISANGHWAFLRLEEHGASVGSLSLTVTTAEGSTSVSYPLDRRTTGSQGPKGFSGKDSFYLIMTDRFADGDASNDVQPGMPYDRQDPHAWHGGDLKGVLDHIGYLKDLGLTTVWLTPHQQNHEPDSYHGYGATDLYAVDEHFGSLDDMKALSKALHQQGMKLVLDTVPNHVGPNHPWVDDSPTPDWFHGTKTAHRSASGVFPALMDPTASQDEVLNVQEGWFADALPDMNQDNTLVSAYLIQNAMWWIEQTSADGLRLDTFPYVNRQFWHDFHKQLFDQYPRLTTVGEVLNDTYLLPPALNAFFAGGSHLGQTPQVDTGLYTPFDYPIYGALRNIILHGAPMTDLDLLLRQDALYPHPERLVTLLGSHDTARFLNDPEATPEKLRLAFGLILTVRGTPMIYSGDEIGMVGGNDPDNRRDFPGGFPSAGMAKSAFDPQTRTPGQSFIHDWVQDLLRIRKASPELSGGEQQVLASDSKTIAYVRGTSLSSGCRKGQERVLVLLNKDPKAVELSLKVDGTSLAGCTSVAVLLGNQLSIKLQGMLVEAEVPAFSTTIVKFN